MSRNVYQCGKYRKGQLAYLRGKPFNENASYAWKLGWKDASEEQMFYDTVIYANQLAKENFVYQFLGD